MLDLRVFPSPIVIGHRGAPGYRPEHSRASFELAFEQGADFVEPDVVVSSDGVLVIRHENEISGTTDVSGHPEFASRRRAKTVDGVEQHGWFTEDFTWAELQTLRCRERLPELRPFSATFDGEFPLLRLADLFALVDGAMDALRRPLGIVAELKHAAYFGRLGFDLAELFIAEVASAGWGLGGREEGGRGEGGVDDSAGRLVVESFEPTVLADLRRRGFGAALVQLVDDVGSPADLVESQGEEAPAYATYLTAAGLRALARAGVDGISVPKALLLGDGRSVVADAHAAGLSVFTWTLRPENAFLEERYRTGPEVAELGDWQGEWSEIVGAGVDGVFSDHPDAAVTVRNEQGDRGADLPY
ncbi:glycerophosphodiester phosphodiesterase family protein [Subtercola boreus]|uniref:glycerophosphodiester phosphodiesterase family protein n=1 Tax=Subtercola boreus TaxID=120213 RepID=UPI00116BE924|nr:glycerophosphodiester phosphodiesterase family protein [Subtercola boreus]TQL52821.1 glycerophosphoryl diester phosphodiesterase [Subtercola boreus]